MFLPVLKFIDSVALKRLSSHYLFQLNSVIFFGTSTELIFVVLWSGGDKVLIKPNMLEPIEEGYSVTTHP